MNIVGFGMVFPIFPLFAQSFHASALDIGLMAAAFSIAQFFAAPVLGRFSDRFGRKPILAFSIGGSALAFLVASVAPNLFILYLSRVINGVATAGNFPIATAYVADITSKEDRSKYVARVAGTFALGFIFGPVIGGLLGGFGFQWAFRIAALVYLVNLAFVFVFLPESLKVRAEKIILREGLFNFKRVYHGLRGDFGALFFLLFCWSFYISNFEVAIPLFTHHFFNWTTVQNGLFFSVTGTTSAITQWFALPYLTSKFGDKQVIIAGCLLMILGQIFAPLVSSALFIGFFIVSITGSGLNRPTVNAVLSKATHTGQGATMGLAFSFESLGRVVGPIIAGFSIGSIGLKAPFYTTCVVLGAGLFFFLRAESKKNSSTSS